MGSKLKNIRFAEPELEVWVGPICTMLYPLYPKICKLKTTVLPDGLMKAWKLGAFQVVRIDDGSWENIEFHPASDKDILEYKLL